MHVGDANWRATMENGYKVWSIQGHLLCHVPIESLYQVLFRPRPPVLLSPSQIRELKDKLREKYYRKFEIEDNIIKNEQLKGVDRERKELRDAWKQYRAEKEQEYAEEAELRAELRGGQLSDDEDDYENIQQIIEEEIERKEEIIKEWSRDDRDYDD